MSDEEMAGWTRSSAVGHEHWYAVVEHTPDPEEHHVAGVFEPRTLGIRCLVVECPWADPGERWFWRAHGHGVELEGRVASRAEAKDAALSAAKTAFAQGGG
jgi:hypothetical protein